METILRRVIPAFFIQHLKPDPSPHSGIQPVLYFEYRNWGPARRVGSPKDNIEQGISNSRSFRKE